MGSHHTEPEPWVVHRVRALVNSTITRGILHRPANDSGRAREPNRFRHRLGIITETILNIRGHRQVRRFRDCQTVLERFFARHLSVAPS